MTAGESALEATAREHQLDGGLLAITPSAHFVSRFNAEILSEPTEDDDLALHAEAVDHTSRRAGVLNGKGRATELPGFGVESYRPFAATGGKVSLSCGDR